MEGVKELVESIHEAVDTARKVALQVGYSEGAAASQARIAELERQLKAAQAEYVDFYEREFYPLSNFSAFTLKWKARTFSTSEAAYQWDKFDLGAKAPDGSYIRDAIIDAPSAHAAFKLAEKFSALRRDDWDDVKVDIMRGILRAKTEQHEYVRRKLLETGERELIECSWRDDFWGWGPDKDGQNMLGKLWMEIRAELHALGPRCDQAMQEAAA